jgi:hypothetical protein
MTRLTFLAEDLILILGITVLLERTSASWAQSGKTKILWLGQSATRITTISGKVIVIDP